MARPQSSAKIRWFVTLAMLALASSMGSFPEPPRSAPPAALDVTKLLPPLFTNSAAQGVPTQVAGCAQKAVIGFKFAITVLEVKATNIGGSDLTITTDDATVDFAGNDGALTPTNLFSGTFTPDVYTAIKPTVSPTLIIKGWVACPLGSPVQTRYYYTDGNANPHASAFELSEAAATAAMAETSIKFGGGAGENFTPTIAVNFTVTAGQSTRVNMPVKNESAFVLWDLSSIVGGEAYMAFPGQPDTSGQADTSGQ